MSRYKHEYEMNERLSHIYYSYIPNRHDSFRRLTIKISFIIAPFILLIAIIFFNNHFLKINKQENYINSSREIWKSYLSEQEKPDALKKANEKLLAINSDYKGWISIDNTKINNPIFQTNNNTYYLNHNQNKKKSYYGALQFDYKNIITESFTDKNLIVYGNNLDNGSMFGTLEKFKGLNYYKYHSTIKLSTLYKNAEYKIFSVFILNTGLQEDSNYVYNIYKQQFTDSNDFDLWINEAYERSLIDTGVDVNIDDRFLTLVTEVNDFENAKLVLMAREKRDKNDTAFTSPASPKTNPNPK